jgi:hypothetical protein
VWIVKHVGPRVIEGYLTASYNRNFKENKLHVYLETVPLAKLGRMWLQYDGSSQDFSREVTTFLKENYEGSWIGRNGPVALLDLNPLHFFLLCGM